MRLAACLIVKNEESSIAEWMAYHLAIGFGTLLIFDNGSTDRTAEIIACCARHADVRRIGWAVSAPTYQTMAYDFAVRHFGAEFDWMAFIDSDEFIVPLIHDTMPAFLDSLPDAPAVALNWAMFGSSGHVARPCGLVIENFTRRSEDSFGPNQHVKSVVRPGSVVRSANAHYFEVRGDYIGPRGEQFRWARDGIGEQSPVFDTIQINHYFVKSRDDWAKKIRRGYHDGDRHESEFNGYDRNDVEDTRILRFRDATKAVLAAIEPS
jgi:glycosyltransferase involved in cell wall biosynthesis